MANRLQEVCQENPLDGIQTLDNSFHQLCEYPSRLQHLMCEDQISLQPKNVDLLGCFISVRIFASRSMSSLCCSSLITFAATGVPPRVATYTTPCVPVTEQ